jgi:hypothetical protein
MTTTAKSEHIYDEDCGDDEGNSLGKVRVYCVDGKLATDFDRNADGIEEPVWFNIINSDDPAPCRVCSGEVKPGYEPPEKVKVTIPYRVAMTILGHMEVGAQAWDHDNENACQEDGSLAKNCSLCVMEDWFTAVLRPAMAPRPVKRRKR